MVAKYKFILGKSRGYVIWDSAEELALRYAARGERLAFLIVPRALLDPEKPEEHWQTVRDSIPVIWDLEVTEVHKVIWEKERK